MNDPTRSSGPGQIAASAVRTQGDAVPAPADAHASEANIRRHQTRLNRLFRHSGSRTADHYLLDLMSRYRGIEPS